MDNETRRGDKAAWQHAIDSGRFRLLTDEQIQQLVLVQLYTAKIDNRIGGISEAEMLVLCEWAENALIEEGLLQNVLSGTAFVRIADGKPSFSITPKGVAEGDALAASLGLPPLGEHR